MVPTDERGLMEINYFGKDKTFDNYSIAAIMDGKYDAALKDKIVVVGATAVGTFDQRVTPLNKITAGVETHANAIETLLPKEATRGIDEILSVRLCDFLGHPRHLIPPLVRASNYRRTIAGRQLAA